MDSETVMQFELVANYTCHCGENPLWHPKEKKLYWADIPTGRMFRYDPASGQHELCYEGRPIGGFTIQQNGDLLLFRDCGNVVVWRNGEIIQTIVNEIQDELKTRFNDVIADFEGRVFCGTMPTKSRLGRLYRLDPDGSCRVVMEEVGCANGMGFTFDGRQLYFTDSQPRVIWLIGYDRQTGELGGKRPFIQIPEGEGVPDGMTVDADGDIWSARWDGWGIYRYDPNGRLRQKIDMPVKKVTSVIFGGDDLGDLYVTSAGGDDPEDNGHQAGALFRLRTDAKGWPEHCSRIGL